MDGIGEKATLLFEELPSTQAERGSLVAEGCSSCSGGSCNGGSGCSGCSGGGDGVI